MYEYERRSSAINKTKQPLIKNSEASTSVDNGATMLGEIFQHGDILYGLDQPRAKYLSALEPEGFKRKEVVKTKNKSLIRRLFNIKDQKEKINILIQNDITNAVWDPALPTEYSNDKKIIKQLNDPQRAIQFRQFLLGHNNYNIKSQPEAAKLKSEPWSAPKIGPALWKKTSKAGLEFQLLNRKKPVHFMADVIGDDISTVVSKQGHGTSITSSELRWLYRHKDLPEVKNNLVFYRNGIRISQEEIFEDNAWAGYEPKNKYKL